MNTPLSSRERMLAALACHEADYVPCCFSAFQSLRQRCADEVEFLDRQLEMGLDTVVTISEAPIRHDARVRIREGREDLAGERYPILHKEYETPAGTLCTAVHKSEDWPWGDHVPFIDDFLIPRSRKFLVTPSDSLEALCYLLPPPTDEEIASLRETVRCAKSLAAERDLLTVGHDGMVGDMACWLCGMQELMMLAVDHPDFVQHVLDVIEDWNRRRMELVLEAGVDLFVRRAWYENADVWSPSQYRRFMLPTLCRDAEMVHQAGAKFGYLMSCASMPLLDMIMDAGVDVLLGIDPAQDRTMDLHALKQKSLGKLCLWGGVCGYLTVECGTPDEIAEQVRRAISILGPGGGFILSPVTNVRADTERAWENVRTLIETWRFLRHLKKSDRASSSASRIESVFEPGGIILDYADLSYNPCDDIIFPSIVKTGGHLSGSLDAYHMYYAPHDPPGGICLAHAPAIEGPWTEYASNPMITKDWPPHYEVGHVSAPDAIWVQGASQLFLYYHGDNDTTHYATSKDGMHFEYGGVAVDQTFYGDFMEDQYDRVFYGRVFEHGIPSGENGYIFLFARSSDQGLHKQGIYLSWSRDARKWSRPTRLIAPTGGARFVCSPCFFSLHDKHYVAYHAEFHDPVADPVAYTDIYVVEVDATLSACKPLGKLMDHGFYEGNPRVSDPCIVIENGIAYLIVAIDKRLNQRFALAKADADELARALAGQGLRTPYSHLREC